jgi:hypothetical protein
MTSSSGGAALLPPTASVTSSTMVAPPSSAPSMPSAAGASAAAAAAAGASASKVPLKPATDVLAGALARALSQSTIHPLDTLKVRMQAGARAAAPPVPTSKGLSKFGQLVPPPAGTRSLAGMGAGLASLYKGVVGAASGAGIAIGAYFACYGVACNVLCTTTDLAPGAVAFVAGGMAAAGSSVVKVPLAVCIRSVQAGVYPNVFAAARSITSAAGPRGLFTGYFPTLLEDVPDMAFKFAAYESMRQVHSQFCGGRKASPHEDFAMGAAAGALAAAATTPLDVIKTNMMCTAASRPTMLGAARGILAAGGPSAFFTGVGTRALSNGINSAVFFCFFEALRGTLARPGGLAAVGAALRSQLAPGEAVTAIRRLAAAASDAPLPRSLLAPPAPQPRYATSFAATSSEEGGSEVWELVEVSPGADGATTWLAVPPSAAATAHRPLQQVVVAGSSPSLSLLAASTPLRLEGAARDLVLSVSALGAARDGQGMQESG